MGSDKQVVLGTGANGFIGSAVAGRLLTRFADFVRGLRERLKAHRQKGESWQ